MKAAACFAAACLTATAAFAQITVDLDVLTEDFIPKDALTSAPLKIEDAGVALKAPEPEKPAGQAEKKESKKEEKQPAAKPAAKAKSAPEKKAAAKPKPAAKPAAKPAVKPAAKKASAPKKPAKPAVKKTTAAKPVEKFHVTESAQSDEHDRLKPRANPVPKVKILATEDSSRRDKNEEVETAVRPAAPKLSKHFLEQERLKERQQAEEKETAAAAEKPAVKQAEAKPAEKPRSLLETAPDTLSVQPKTLLRTAGGAETPAGKTAAKQPVRFSVFPVSSKLTPEERSARLAQEIPQDSATAAALKHNRALYHIFIFETGATQLGDEMQAALDAMAEQLKKYPSKRVSLYSYSAPDPVRTGGERQHSLRRALAVRSYLAQQGINTLRMEIRSFGQKGAGSKIPDRTDILIKEK